MKTSSHVLLHAVNERTGFLPDCQCQLLFQSHLTHGRDYHTEMNSAIYEYWVEHNLLPSITEPAWIMHRIIQAFQQTQFPL